MDKAVRQLAVSAGMPVEPQEVVISHPEGIVVIVHKRQDHAERARNLFWI